MNNQMPSLDLMYELVKDNYERVSRWADSLDNKVIGLFGLTTILIGAVTAVTASSIVWNAHIIPLCVAIVAFIVSSCFALRCFQTRQFMLGYDPGVLLEDYASLQPNEAKYWVMKHDAYNYEHNRQLINEKADALRWAILAAAIEVIALVIWMVVC